MNESINDQDVAYNFLILWRTGSIIIESRLHKNNIKKNHIQIMVVETLYNAFIQCK